MSFQPVLSRIDASGRALFRCPSCAATSDTGVFQVSASEGRMECVTPNKKHSRPCAGKIIEFIITYPPKP
jgi:hypothetical protein